MAKSVEIPDTEFKTTLEPASADDAFSVIEDKRDGVLVMVPFDAIHPIANFNIRVHTPDYEAHVEAVKDSIIANGFYRHKPLKVHPVNEGEQNLLYLADGYTRFEAARRAVAAGAKISRLPVVATSKGTTLDDLFVGLYQDNSGRLLSPFEKAILVKRLQSNDNDETEIATALGITTQYVNDLLSLMGAPKAMHNMVINGEVAAALAIEMLKEHGSGKKAVEVLKAAGAIGERQTNGEPVVRVTRSRVARTGGTTKAGKRLYEALIEYLIVLNGTSGAQSAMDYLLRWHEKDPEAIKELTKQIPKPKVKKAKEKNPKDVRIKITDEMSDDEKKDARSHNREVKKRKERREAREAKKAAEAAIPAGDI